MDMQNHRKRNGLTQARGNLANQKKVRFCMALGLNKLVGVRWMLGGGGGGG